MHCTSKWTLLLKYYSSWSVMIAWYMGLKEMPSQKCIHHDAAWHISKQRCQNKSLFVPFSKDERYQGLSLGVLVIVSKLEELLSLHLLTWPSISAACCNSQHHRRHGYNTALQHRPGRLYLSETHVFILSSRGFKSESFPNSCSSLWKFHSFITSGTSD